MGGFGVSCCVGSLGGDDCDDGNDDGAGKVDWSY